VNMYTFVSALKYMFIPFLMLVFLLSLLVSWYKAFSSSELRTIF
jgi:hypothetical protein